MTNVDSLLKGRDITLPTKVCLVKAMVFPVVMYGCKSWTIKKAECLNLMPSNCGVGEDSWESLREQGVPTSQSQRKPTLTIHWKDWCWSWSSDTLATWWKEPTHWKRPWHWERLKAGREWEDRGWDTWIVSLTQWTWIWANSGSWWWTGKPACCRPWGHKESDTTEQLKSSKSSLWRWRWIYLAQRQSGYSFQRGKRNKLQLHFIKRLTWLN